MMYAICRLKLFKSINSAPTLYEIITGRASRPAKLNSQNKRKRADSVWPPDPACILCIGIACKGISTYPASIVLMGMPAARSWTAAVLLTAARPYTVSCCWLQQGCLLHHVADCSKIIYCSKGVDCINVIGCSTFLVCSNDIDCSKVCDCSTQA